MFSPMAGTSEAKLARKWHGPMMILEKISNHSYKVKDTFSDEVFVTHLARLRLLERVEILNTFVVTAWPRWTILSFDHSKT
jgi:hypothetical protein